MDTLDIDNPDKRFQVALSFPGERRAFVAEVARYLADALGKERVLYDTWYSAEFARPNLNPYLPNLYKDQSELIAVFLCADYQRKDWCGLEWRVVLDLIQRREDSAIMLLRFDKTEIPGFYASDGYLWIGDELAPDQVAEQILERRLLNAGQRSRPAVQDTQSDLDTDHEYLIDDDALALAMRLDHQAQCESVDKLLARPGSDPAIAFVECGPKDWPLDLAHHIQTEHGPRNEQALSTQAIDLKLRVLADTGAFWDALVQTTPGASSSPDPQAVVRGDLSARRVAVLYTSVNLHRSGWHLPKILRGANDVLRQLGDLADARVLVLIAGYRSWRRPPPWWRWWVAPRIKRLGYCHSLPAMRRLESADLDEWYSDFPASLRSRYSRDRLKSELLRLFQDDEDEISHDAARNLLTGWPDGQSALDRARC